MQSRCSDKYQYIAANFGNKVPDIIGNAQTNIMNYVIDKKAECGKHLSADQTMHMTVYQNTYASNSFRNLDNGCSELLKGIQGLKFYTVSSNNPSDYMSWGNWVAFPLNEGSSVTFSLHVSLFKIDSKMPSYCKKHVEDAIKSLKIKEGAFSGNQFKGLQCNDGKKDMDCSKKYEDFPEEIENSLVTPIQEEYVLQQEEL